MSEGVTIEIDHNPNDSFGDGSGKVRYEYGTGNNKVEVTEIKDPNGIKGYKQCSHKPMGHNKIKEIKKGDIALEELKQYLSGKSSVVVYLRNVDRDYKSPLLIQLGYDYYTSGTGTRWSIESVSYKNLQNALDKQNCLRNKVHVASVCDTDGKNKCKVCNSGIISTKSYDTQLAKYKYIRFTHTISEGSFGSIRNAGNTIHLITGNVMNIHVYWYSITGKSTPLLFCYESGGSLIWYSRYHGDSTWSEESTLTGQNPTSLDNTPSRIQGLLGKYIIPNIIIDISKPANIPYQPNKNILYFNVTSKEYPESKCYGFTHTESKTNLFAVKQVVYNGIQLKGISSSDPIVSVTAYYLRNSPKEEELLLVELAIKTNPITYKSYERSTGELSTWSPLERSGVNGTRVDNSYLKEKVDALNNGYLSGYSSDSSSQSSVSPSGPSVGAIVGGVIGALAAVLVLGFAVWKGRSMLRKSV